MVANLHLEKPPAEKKSEKKNKSFSIGRGKKDQPLPRSRSRSRESKRNENSFNNGTRAKEFRGWNDHAQNGKAKAKKRRQSKGIVFFSSLFMV